MKLCRGTEASDAPGWQGERSPNIGNIRATSNAASRDAAFAECRQGFTTGSLVRGRGDERSRGHGRFGSSPSPPDEGGEDVQEAEDDGSGFAGFRGGEFEFEKVENREALAARLTAGSVIVTPGNPFDNGRRGSKALPRAMA